ncbi:MAG: membrane protein insertase YidC [Gammaproteobacteria bacterium]
MDNKRLFLFVALAFVVLLIWQAWQADYGQQALPVSAGTTANPTNPKQASTSPPLTADVPQADQPITDPAATATVPAAIAGGDNGFAHGQTVQVITDVVHAQIDTVGGDLRELKLLNYPIAANKPEQPFPLLNDTLPNLFVAQSGLIAGANGPDHHAVFVPEQASYRLPENARELKVRLRWDGPAGITVTKVYTFSRNSYEIGLDYEINNASAQAWSGRLYGQFQRVVDESQKSAFIYTYTGGVLSSVDNKYEKIDFDDMADQDLNRTIKGGWAAILQHYFVGAWIPKADQSNQYYSKALPGKRYILGVMTPETSIPAGTTGTLSTRMYAGPKLQDHLAEVAPGLELTVDYGLLTVIAEPIFWLLKQIHDIVQNWGWSIVLLTLLIKLAFYKLSAASYRSMANMRRLQPRIAALKERYGDDRQRMSQGMMELYKTEKINPLGGCLPVLVQIPVFIALYWVLLESVELRQADFMLWINDLSSPDPYYILPLLMGITMFIQQKLSPAPPDPLQAKVMMILPPVFTLFFAFFPAGLVLYWVANNTLSIAQQWYITRTVEQGKGRSSPTK